VSQRWIDLAKIATQQLSGPGALTPEAIMRLTWMKWSHAIGAAADRVREKMGEAIVAVIIPMRVTLHVMKL
jgi:hypothetical protein